MLLPCSLTLSHNSIPFNITYAPSVVITFGHGLESGDVTSLKVVETFAEFGDPVDGVNVGVAA